MNDPRCDSPTRWWRRLSLVLLLPVIMATRPAPADEKPPVVPVTPPAPRTEIPKNLPDPAELAEVTIDLALRPLVDDLSSASYEVREEAMSALIRRNPEIAQLCAILADDALTAEQRFRILMVVQQQLVSAPRGAVGIRMEWKRPETDVPGEIEIIDLLPGLPGERVLELGDRITHVSGQQLESANDLIILVQTKQPGDKVALRLRRAVRDERGEVVTDDEGKVVRRLLELDLELGSAEQLIDPKTGLPQRGGLVERERLDQAKELARRFAPKPDLVDLEGVGSERLIATAWPPSTRLLRSHPDVSAIREHIQRIEVGQIPLTAARRAGLMNQVEVLAELAERPDLSPADRAYVQKLATRILELVTE